MFPHMFPYIKHIDQVLEAVEGSDEFKFIWKDEGFYVINYMVAYSHTFPSVNTNDEYVNEMNRIRRECRGIKFDRQGHIIARPFHKFFGIDEKDETSQNKIDWKKNFIILEKLDGSMIHPIFLNNEVVYCTKHGPTDVAKPVQEFADRGILRMNDQKYCVWYNDFCHDMMKSGYTPIFEWCSRKQRIVIDYPEDKLVLTAIRGIKDGQYLDYENMKTLAEPYNVPVVSTYPGTFTGVKDFINDVQGRTDEEGYVIRFSHEMYKIKNPWYLQLHKTAELMQNEKDVWKIILDDQLDDAKAFMNDEDKERLDKFQSDLFHSIDSLADKLNWIVIAAKDNFNGSKKQFALEEVPKYPVEYKPLLFKIWDGHDARNVIINYAHGQTVSNTKLENAKNLLNLDWNNY